MYTILRPTIVLTDHSIHSRVNLRVSNGGTDLSDLSGDTTIRNEYSSSIN